VANKPNYASSLSILTMDKILLIAICGLGDMVCYTPTVKELIKKYPYAKILILVATDQARELLEKTFSNIEVRVFNRGREGWAGSIKTVLNLRKEHFDLVMSRAPYNSMRIPLAAFFSGSRIRVGALQERLNFLYNVRVDIPEDMHAVQRYRKMLTAIGLEIPETLFVPHLEPPESDHYSANYLWSKIGIKASEMVVGLVSGADANKRGDWRPSLKRWDIKRYGQVAHWLTKQKGAKVVMFGTDKEASLSDSAAKAGATEIVNLCGRTRLGELMWHIKKCQLIVCNDTGTMHLASALGTPVVALFGPTSPSAFGPLGPANRVISGKASCAPCFPRPTCNLENCLAMDSIDPSEVVDNIEQLMRS